MNLLGRAAKIPASVVNAVRNAMKKETLESEEAPSVLAPDLEAELNKVPTTTTKAGDSMYPTAAEIEEYCRRATPLVGARRQPIGLVTSACPCASRRDPDSSGCDIGMVEALMAEAAKLKAEQERVHAGYNDVQKAFMKSEPLRWQPAMDEDGEEDDYGLAV